jgi:hypothetical protein
MGSSLKTHYRHEPDAKKRMTRIFASVGQRNQETDGPDQAVGRVQIKSWMSLQPERPVCLGKNGC